MRCTYLIPSLKNKTMGDFSVFLEKINGRPLLVWTVNKLQKSSDEIHVCSTEGTALKQSSVFDCYPWNLSSADYSYIGVAWDEGFDCDFRENLIKKIRLNAGISSIEIVTTDVILLNNEFLKEDYAVYKDENLVKVKISQIPSFLAILEKDDEFVDAISDYIDKFALTRIHVDSNRCIDLTKPTSFQELRYKLIESRSFNSLHIDPIFPIITKCSSDWKKLQNEVLWYKTIPEMYRSLAPQVYSEKMGEISMEYYGYGTLTPKFVYENLSLATWEKILRKLFQINKKFRETKSEISHKEFELFYVKKYESRITQIENNPVLMEYLKGIKNVNGLDISSWDKLRIFTEKKIQKIVETSEATVVHGDYCFNNLLYDISTGIVKCIDPRGSLNGSQFSFWGDPRYDIAKLRHSFVGGYDLIVEGQYRITQSDNGKTILRLSKDKYLSSFERMFDNLSLEFGYDVKDIRFLEAYLFLTMIPLHCESINKMKCFLLTALYKLQKCMQEDDDANLY